MYSNGSWALREKGMRLQMKHTFLILSPRLMRLYTFLKLSKVGCVINPSNQLKFKSPSKLTGRSCNIFFFEVSLLWCGFHFVPKSNIMKKLWIGFKNVSKSKSA